MTSATHSTRIALASLVCLASVGSVRAQSRELHVVRTIESDTLASPFALVEGTDGTLFLSDLTAQGLFRISTDDEWDRFARKGEGPGELQIFGGLSLKGDTVVALDPGSRSLVLFSASGEYIDELSIDMATAVSIYPLSFPAVLGPSGEIITFPAVGSGQMSSGNLETVPFLRFSRDGAFRDTLFEREVAATVVSLDTGPGFKPLAPELFQARPDLVLDRRGTYLTRLEETDTGLRLTWIDLADKSKTVREWDLPRNPLRRQDRDAVLDRWAEGNSERLELPVARIRALLDDAITVPEFEPLFTEAFGGSGGFVWVRGFSTTEDVTWTRFSPDGRPPVTVTLPSGDEVMDAGEDWLWVQRKDFLDIPSFVKLRVR